MENDMSEVIAGIRVPDTLIAREATAYVREQVTSLLFDHSVRVFLFGSLHARARGLEADPELLYAAALFHDAGLFVPPSDTPQRFEIDGADMAHEFLMHHGASSTAAETVWNAIALHTTPAIPVRMGPEIAATNLGVLTDAVGVGLSELDHAAVADIVAAYPRGDFKNDFLVAFHEGLRHRPDTTYGTVNSDIFEYFDPGFRSGSLVDRVMSSPWES